VICERHNTSNGIGSFWLRCIGRLVTRRTDRLIVAKKQALLLLERRINIACLACKVCQAMRLHSCWWTESNEQYVLDVNARTANKGKIVTCWISIKPYKYLILQSPPSPPPPSPSVSVSWESLHGLAKPEMQIKRHSWVVAHWSKRPVTNKY
jgi:hypothetical protein